MATAIAPPDEFIVKTRRWLEEAVIGLNLCPFAKPVFEKKQIRYVVSLTIIPDEIMELLRCELTTLVKENPKTIQTTLIILPRALPTFFEFNQFLNVADELLKSLKLLGQIQIASFHPEFQFAENHSDAIENHTNRSPYPILHLLRESSVEEVLRHFPNPDGIYLKNIETMRRLGPEGWKKLMHKINLEEV